MWLGQVYWLFIPPDLSADTDRYATNCHLSDLSWEIITAQNLTRESRPVLSASNLTHAQPWILTRACCDWEQLPYAKKVVTSASSATLPSTFN